jgi:uncharacterized protein YcbX
LSIGKLFILVLLHNTARILYLFTKYKRKWLIVDEKGSFLTQRQFPKMALIQPKVDGDFLVLTAEGMPDLKITISQSKDKINCRYFLN